MLLKVRLRGQLPLFPGPAHRQVVGLVDHLGLEFVPFFYETLGLPVFQPVFDPALQLRVKLAHYLLAHAGEKFVEARGTAGDSLGSRRRHIRQLLKPSDKAAALVRGNRGSALPVRI